MRFLRWKIVIPGLLVVILAAAAGVGWGGWYLSDVLKDGALVPKRTPPKFDLEAVAIDEGRVTLRVTPDADADGPWTMDGTWGLEWDKGYDQVGRILEINDRQVVREHFPMREGPKVGDLVRLDSKAFPDDPETALGIPFEVVSYRSPLGEFPAWFVEGSSTTWAIFVHGRGSHPDEGLRMLPTVVALGLPSLLIHYRNDEGEPSNPDGFFRYGQTEWEDLEGAATYAIEHGAEEIILVGYSMGGAIVANFLYESPLADRVSGAILDAPMIDFNATIDLGASQRGYPQVVAELGKFVSGLRFDVDWGALDYLGRADDLDVPILLFHGDADDTVPVETSDALAEARPDIVKYIRVAGAAHVRAWNTDPATYEAAVDGFLRDVVR